MRIAVAVDSLAPDAMVADVYEESTALFVVETDDNTIVEVVEGPDMEEYLMTMLMKDCEAVVCTPCIGEDAFEPIARAGLTRYNGSGLPALEAVQRALKNELDLICDFEGGTGCESGTGSCSEHDFDE